MQAASFSGHGIGLVFCCPACFRQGKLVVAEAMTACMLGVVKCRIGAVDQLLQRHARQRYTGSDADAGGDMCCCCGTVVRKSQSVGFFQQTLRYFKRTAHAGIRQQQGKFFAAVACRQISRAFGMIRNEERAVNPSYWMNVHLEDREGYVLLMREARMLLVREGFYDRRMLNIIKRIRCAQSPSDDDCVVASE